MDIEVENRIPQQRYTLTLTPIDDPQAPPVVFPWNPEEEVINWRSNWELRGTAGARWDGQPDRSDWSGNEPRTRRLSGRWASLYTGEGVAAASRRELSRLIAFLHGIYRRPTDLTGAPSRLRVECGDDTPYVAVLLDVDVTILQRDASGVPTDARISMTLRETSED